MTHHRKPLVAAVLGIMVLLTILAAGFAEASDRLTCENDMYSYLSGSGLETYEQCK
jgi:hypothetical protein